ncbi:MAG: hypothetical protein LQ342_000225 [Letrouitia transgressa]|nr:MAG: hypothetical protein LQ342_000225 [Letrouitia transgressa]
MPPPQVPTTPSIESATPGEAKRRRLGERNNPNPSQLAHEQELQKLADKGHTQYYDPNQSMAERRRVRKGIRDLSKELTDSRAEYLSAGSNGLINTLEKANRIFDSVKQTSDATLDSRLLVSTADLSAKRTTQLNLGDQAHGIEVDQFIGKCITYMRRGPANADGTQASSVARRRRRVGDSSDEEQAGYDEGDEFDWDYLGRSACCPHNRRPAVSGFLLGPLAVQTKVRKQTQRRERLQRRDPADAVRPEELKEQDLEKVENSNLTTLCKNIRELLAQKMNSAQAAVEEEVTDEMSDEELKRLMVRHGVADDGGMRFFPFVINPRSFGQTVENLFYVSFLIRDGVVSIGHDADMLPTLLPHSERAAAAERKRQDFADEPGADASRPREAKVIQAEGIQKHQAVFHLDFETWEDLIRTFEIKESVIPHRQSEEETQVGASGWYA